MNVVIVLQMKKEKSKAVIPEATGKKDKDKKAAWIAVRCAAAVGQAIRSRLLLTGRSTTMVHYLVTISESLC